MTESRFINLLQFWIKKMHWFAWIVWMGMKIC